MSSLLDRVHLGCAALSGEIYVGRVSKLDPRVFSSKKSVTHECFAAIVQHMQTGEEQPCAVQKTFSFDGGQRWWRLTVEPVDPPDDGETVNGNR